MEINTIHTLFSQVVYEPKCCVNFRHTCYMACPSHLARLHIIMRLLQNKKEHLMWPYLLIIWYQRTNHWTEFLKIGYGRISLEPVGQFRVSAILIHKNKTWFM
jgi:hypothetical protein